MADLQLSELIIDAAVTKLNAGLAARIATINTEKNDDVVLTTPTVYPFGIAPPPPGPLVIVTDGGSPEGSQFAAEGPHSFAYDLQLVVLVKADDSNQASLSRRLLRYERAVIETLWDDAPREQLTVTVGAVTNRPYINPARVIPGPVFNAQNDESLLSSYRIAVFKVTKREN